MLYISGVPGVGKTISTMEVIAKIKKTVNAKKVVFKYINAMSLLTPGNIYTSMNKELFKAEKNDIQGKPFKLAMKLQ